MLTIRIPGRIDPDLSPNCHKHWRAKHRAQQAAKHAAKACAEAITSPQERDGGDYDYHVVVGLAKGERVKDDDNAAAMTKHYRDGLALGLGCRDDKGWRYGGIEQVRDPEGVGFILFLMARIENEEAA